MNPTVEFARVFDLSRDSMYFSILLIPLNVFDGIRIKIFAPTYLTNYHRNDISNNLSRYVPLSQHFHLCIRDLFEFNLVLLIKMPWELYISDFFQEIDVFVCLFLFEPFSQLLNASMLFTSRSKRQE